MEIRALVSFAGGVSMAKGEERAVSESLAADLIQAGYAEAVRKGEKRDEVKRGDPGGSPAARKKRT